MCYRTSIRVFSFDLFQERGKNQCEIFNVLKSSKQLMTAIYIAKTSCRIRGIINSELANHSQASTFNRSPVYKGTQNYFTNVTEKADSITMIDDKHSLINSI